MAKKNGYLRRLFGKNIPGPVMYSIVFVCVLAVGGLGFGVYSLVPSSPRPATACMDSGATDLQIEGPGKECIGITDGSYPLDQSDSDLTQVENLIETENHTITQDHPTDYVSVVMLLPISGENGSDMTLTTALEQLRGAYTAQHYANNSNENNAHGAFIQLLIGNDGYQADQEQEAVDVIRQVQNTEHVVAVDGLGVSLDTTEAAAKSLTQTTQDAQATQDQIPVFGSTITSDDFDDVPDLVRVSPDNATEAAVALDYIAAHFTAAVFVKDINTDDTYDSTLVTGFAKFGNLPGHSIVDPEPFDSTSRDAAQTPAAAAAAEAVVQTQISHMSDGVCTAQQGHPAVVLFTGRGDDLSAFISDMATRPCLDKPITVITGDGATNLTFDKNVKAGLLSGVTVYYAGVANPGEWSQITDPNAVNGYNVFTKAFTPTFGTVDLSDGNSVMAYDAMLTSIKAIQLTDQPQPPSYAVAGEITALHGSNTVYGASGPIAFDADPTTDKTASNPVDKPVPILQLEPDGSSQFVQLF
ncbi:MAG TPA: hypothetical protein VGX23_16420 [Actinocrinis sp.]|nr:hypothetical protein [Actinocrinis sp.]